MATTIRAYIGLGSNLANPVRQVTQALHELNTIADSRVEARSRLYRTSPVGPQDQPDYINAVACVATRLDARELFNQLNVIERHHGRVRTVDRWGPRTLDLDLLLFGDAILAEPDLVVPHAALHERAFVLVPLFEIAPDLVVPSLGAVRDLLNACDRRGVTPVDSADFSRR